MTVARTALIGLGLQRVYRDTVYWIDAHPHAIAVRIDESNVQLDRLLAARSERRWIFITACNPRSKRSSSWRNHARQHALLQSVRRSGKRWLNGLGEGLDNEWLPEPSIVVFGLGPHAGRRLGRQFGQFAVVAGRLGGRAQLLWCDQVSTGHIVDPGLASSYAGTRSKRR